MIDSQLREPDRNELFARAARCIGEAEDRIAKSRKHPGIEGAWNTLDLLMRSQQAMLMLIVKMERTQDNLVRSRGS